MKTLTARYIFMLFCMLNCIAASAQEINDSSDVFFRHLQLNEVVVTGITGQTRLRDAATPVTLISAKELLHTAATNLVEALSIQPGLASVSTGTGISKPVVRGLGYNRVVVINDGVRQEGQQWGDEHGLEIDASDVHAVEILKGPASLMYGSDAMAGVIVMKEQPAVPSGEQHLNLSAEHQTNMGLWGTSLNYAGNLHQWIWNLRASGKWAHAYKNRWDGRVPGSQWAEQAASLLVGTNRSWGHSHLKLSVYHQTPSIIEGERNEDTGNLCAETDKLNTYGHTLPFQKITHYKAVNDNFVQLNHGTLKTIISYQQNQRREYEDERDSYGMYLRLHTMSYDVRYMLDPVNGWKAGIGAGGMFQYSKNEGTEFLVPDAHLADAGLYSTVSKDIQKWTLSGGLRADIRWLHAHSLIEDDAFRFFQLSRRFSGVTGSIGAVYHLNSRMNIRWNMARGYRAPNLSELSSNGIHEGTLRYETGNAQLHPEYSLQTDLGMDFTSRHLTAQIALFCNRIDHYIYSARTGELSSDAYPVYHYTQGLAQIAGGEFFIDIHPIHSLHLSSTFSYVHGTQRHVAAPAHHLPMMPSPRWRNEIKYEITHDGSSLNNSWIAATVDQSFRQNLYYAIDQTESATPSYTLLSLAAGTDIMIREKKVAEITVTAENLTDRCYQNHLSRLKYAEVNTRTGRTGVHNMGRNIVVKCIFPIQLL